MDLIHGKIPKEQLIFLINALAQTRQINYNIAKLEKNQLHSKFRHVFVNFEIVVRRCHTEH